MCIPYYLLFELWLVVRTASHAEDFNRRRGRAMRVRSVRP